MANKNDSNKPDEKKANAKDTAPKKKYKIVGSDFKFKGTLYKEGKIIAMTEAEYKLEKKKIGLELQEVENG